MRRYMLVTLVLTCLLVGTSVAFADSNIKIGALVKTLSNEFWQEMADGYRDAAARFGVEIEIGAMNTEAEVLEQLAMMEVFVSKGYKALCVSAMTTQNLIPGIVQANQAGIPVIAVDEEPDPAELKAAGGFVTTVIRTNPYSPGILAAEWMIDNLDGG